MKLFNLSVYIFFFSSAVAQSVFPKKVIQFGWDYPTISFMRQNLSDMEKKPFDGVAFSFDFKIYDLFDTTKFPLEKFQFDDLSHLKSKILTDNFIRVRAQSKNGPQWFNDQGWNNIVLNIRNISKAIQLSGAKGILLDPEYYYHNWPEKNSWVYDSLIYPGYTYEQVGEKVKLRGKQFVQAIQYYKKDPAILSLYMLSLVTLQARIIPIYRTGMALYPFFIEGMMSGKNKSTSIIDGNELGFSYSNQYQFVFSGNEIRQWGIDLMPEKLKSVYSLMTISQPVFYDLIFGKFDKYEKGLSKQQKQNWLFYNLYYAFKTSDKYVWFYNSNLDWWRKDNNDLSNLVLRVKQLVKNEYENKANLLSGKSSRMNLISQKIEETNAYSLKLYKSIGELTITLNDSDVASFFVFMNSKLIYSINRPPKRFTINIQKIGISGNLITASINSKKEYSFCFIN